MDNTEHTGCCNPSYKRAYRRAVKTTDNSQKLNNPFRYRLDAATEMAVDFERRALMDAVRICNDMNAPTKVRDIVIAALQIQALMED